MADFFHNCSMCSYCCCDSDDLLKHTVKEHKNDPNFLVHCSICGMSCDKWNSFQRPVKRKHSELDSDTRDERNDGEDIRHLDGRTDPNTINPGIINPTLNPGASDDTGWGEDTATNTIDEMQWHAARFVLNLKEKCNVTQVTVDHTIDATKDLLSQIVGAIKKKVTAKCDEANISLSDIEGNEDCSLFDTSFIFENINSEFLQKKFFKETFNLVVSSAYLLICMKMEFCCTER